MNIGIRRKEDLRILGTALCQTVPFTIGSLIFEI